MVSIKKLYQHAKMYMNLEEIQAIQSGKIKEYLGQFNGNYAGFGSSQEIDQRAYNSVDPRMSPMPYQAIDEQHQINLQNMRHSNTTAKKRYAPDSQNFPDDMTTIIDLEMRNTECSFLNRYNTVTGKTGRGAATTFGVVQLDFEDFYQLMMLKIEYQKRSIQQTHNITGDEEFKGMGSVEYAAVQAYGARLSMRPGERSNTNDESDQDAMDTQRQQF